MTTGRGIPDMTIDEDPRIVTIITGTLAVTTVIERLGTIVTGIRGTTTGGTGAKNAPVNAPAISVSSYGLFLLDYIS